MQRNPIDVMEKRYNSNLVQKTIHPRIFYHQCCKCKQEYKHETMFRFETTCLCFSFHQEYEGCTHCFSDIEDMKNWLYEQKVYLRHEDFEFMKKVTQPGYEPTDTELKRYLEIQCT